MKKKSRCIQCVIRFLEIDCASTDRLKQVGYIFDLDPSNLDKQYMKIKGETIKNTLDNRKKDQLNSLLQGNRRYGYQIGSEMGFKSDYAFYHWVKRVYGITFKELVRQQRNQSQSSL